jgi:hypothetical protein
MRIIYISILYQAHAVTIVYIEMSSLNGNSGESLYISVPLGVDVAQIFDDVALREYPRDDAHQVVLGV